MEKLQEASKNLVNNVESFISESIREKQALAEEATRLADYDEAIKAREADVASIEVSENAKEDQEARNKQLRSLQSEIAADAEDLARGRKALAEDKEKWESQKEADQRGIDNERQDIRNQNAALAKEKEEYKEKVLKKLKAGV